MSRFGTTYQAQAEGNVIRPAWMVRLDMPDGVLAYTSWVKSFSYGGDTYTPKGIAFDQVFEGADLNSHQIAIELPATDSNLVAQFIVDNYHWRDANVYLGLLDSDHNLAADPYAAWTGRISNASVTLGKTNAVSVLCEDLLADLGRTCSTTFTSICQKQRYPGDTFFDAMLNLKGRRIIWGGSSVGGGGAPGPGLGNFPVTAPGGGTVWIT